METTPVADLAVEAAPAGAPVVECIDLYKEFHVGRSGVFGRGATVHAVDGVSLSIAAGETLGMVGESGSGKSTLGRLLARLEQPTSGVVRFVGADLANARGNQLRRLRRDLQVVFQDPSTSLDPRWTIGMTVQEPLRSHGVGNARQRDDRVAELLDLVGIRPEMATRLPHELSGGQRQRVGIARAIALEPKLIIADEPVSALDVSVQAQVMNLLQDLQRQLGFACLFIGHGLNVVRHISTRVAVMYLGSVVELGPADVLFDAPSHPYTQALLSAVPTTRPDRRPPRVVLHGDPASPTNPPSGCRFHPRCPLRPLLPESDQRQCAEVAPALDPKAGSAAACHFPLTADGRRELLLSSVEPRPASPARRRNRASVQHSAQHPGLHEGKQ